MTALITTSMTKLLAVVALVASMVAFPQQTHAEDVPSVVQKPNDQAAAARSSAKYEDPEGHYSFSVSSGWEGLSESVLAAFTYDDGTRTTAGYELRTTSAGLFGLILITEKSLSQQYSNESLGALHRSLAAEIAAQEKAGLFTDVSTRLDDGGFVWIDVTHVVDGKKTERALSAVFPGRTEIVRLELTHIPNQPEPALSDFIQLVSSFTYNPTYSYSVNETLQPTDDAFSTTTNVVALIGLWFAGKLGPILFAAGIVYLIYRAILKKKKPGQRADSPR